MKKKGFTLVELLAVIVILAIIALISTPIILNVIEESKKGAAEQSALGYIDALEKQIIVEEMNNKKIIEDGTYNVSSLDVEVKGIKPKAGLITTENKEIKKAKLCINNYSINYENSKAKIVENNYCSDEYKITLIVNEKETTKNIGTKTSTEIEIKEDINNLTNISCNNGTVPKIEGNKLIVTNILGDTTCSINNTLEKTITNLDNTETNIVMLSDETTSDTLIIEEDRDVVLDLNGKTISSVKTFIKNYGYLIVDDSQSTGKIISAVQVLSNSGERDLVVNGGTFERSNGTGATVYNENNGTIIINNGNFYNTASGITIQNNLTSTSDLSGKIVINGGVFISNASDAIFNGINSILNINQTNVPIYISSLSQEWRPAILNYSIKNTYISGNSANDCNNDFTKTVSGLCVYANTENGAVQNVGTGNMTINGGTYIAGFQGINNNYYGIINIVNVNIISEIGILNNSTGTINICNSFINTSKQDIYQKLSDGIINYSNNVIFTNNTNVPIIGGTNINVNQDYNGNCF